MDTRAPARTALYLRISDDRADDAAGVARQEKECRALADRLGWPVAEVFKDNDISASSYSRKKRTDYHRLVEAIKSGRIDSVICWASDRMFRRPDEQEQYIQLCHKFNIENAAVVMGEIDFDTAAGKFNARNLCNMAAFESDRKSERIRSKHLEIAEAGGWHGGIRCFGYEPDGMTVRDAEATEIRRLADAVIHGQSLRSLALELNKRAMLTVKGKRWSSAHLGRMLVRPRLAGLREHRGKIIGPAAWPAILDGSTWEACKAVLQDPARRNGGGGRRGPTPNSFGTGIYICGACGKPRLRLGRSNGRTPIYKCGGAMDLPSQGGHVTRVAAQLDAHVEGVLLELLSRPGALEAMCSVVGSEDHDVTALQREQRAIRKQLKSLAASCDAGDIDAEQLAIASRRKRQRDSEITAVLTAVRQRSPVSVLLGADSVQRIWDEQLTIGQKRAILTEVLTVTVLPAPVRGGRGPGGSYFNPDSVRVGLTERARAATQ